MWRAKLEKRGAPGLFIYGKVRDGAACLPAACGAAYMYTRGGEQSAAEILAPWQGPVCDVT